VNFEEGRDNCLRGRGIKVKNGSSKDVPPKRSPFLRYIKKRGMTLIAEPITRKPVIKGDKQSEGQRRLKVFRGEKGKIFVTSELVDELHWRRKRTVHLSAVMSHLTGEGEGRLERSG